MEKSSINPSVSVAQPVVTFPLEIVVGTITIPLININAGKKGKAILMRPLKYFKIPEELLGKPKLANDPVWQVFSIVKTPASLTNGVLSEWAYCNICAAKDIQGNNLVEVTRNAELSGCIDWWVRRQNKTIGLLKAHVSLYHSNIEPNLLPISEHLISHTECAKAYRDIGMRGFLQRLDDAVVKFFVVLIEPLSHIDDQRAFAGIFKILKEVMPLEYVPFSRQTLTRRIQVLFIRVRHIVKAMLESVPGLAIATDHFSSRVQQGYFCVIASFISFEHQSAGLRWIPKTLVLSCSRDLGKTVAERSHSGKNIAKEMDTVVNDFEIGKKFVGLVSDTAAPMLISAAESKFVDEYQPCFNHVGALVVNDSIYTISSSLAFARSLSALSSASTVFTDCLKTVQQEAISKNEFFLLSAPANLVMEPYFSFSSEEENVAENSIKSGKALTKFLDQNLPENDHLESEFECEIDIESDSSDDEDCKEQDEISQELINELLDDASKPIDAQCLSVLYSGSKFSVKQLGPVEALDSSHGVTNSRKRKSLATSEGLNEQEVTIPQNKVAKNNGADMKKSIQRRALRLKMEATTRWLWIVIMLSRHLLIWDYILLALKMYFARVDSAKQKERIREMIDNMEQDNNMKNSFRCIVYLLEGYKSATLAMQSRVVPNLSMVFPLVKSINKLLVDPPSGLGSDIDSWNKMPPACCDFRNMLIECSNKRFEALITPLAITATVLDSRFMKLVQTQCWTQFYRESLQELLYKACEKLHDTIINANPLIVDKMTTKVTEFEIFKVLQPELTQLQVLLSVEEEVKSFLDMVFLSPPSTNSNPYEFWPIYSARFPRIAVVAAVYLAYRGSQATAESCFSTTSAIITPHRSSMSADLVSMLVFLKWNYEEALSYWSSLGKDINEIKVTAADVKKWKFRELLNVDSPVVAKEINDEAEADVMIE